MRIEQAAYANRWRAVSPAAKALLAGCGFIAAFAAQTPGLALAIAALLVLLTCLGAGVRPGLYLAVAAPAIGFLALSCLSLLLAVDLDASGDVHWQLADDAGSRIATLAGRSLAALAALLGLVLTTPLPDLLALGRRLRLPDVLLDLMVISYRMLFVFSEALHDILTAQKARLGFADTRRSLRSLALLTANLAVQIWQRAHALQQAAEARNAGHCLRFLEPTFAQARRDAALAAVAGGALISLALWGRI